MKLKFTFIKNNEYIINREEIKYIKNKDIKFLIDKEKYTYRENILEKDTEDTTIILDFEKKICKIILKKENYILNLNINVINYEKSDKLINITYNIESEPDVNNTIIIRFKNS